MAYDAVHRHDRRARVGPVHNMVAFTPADPGSAHDRAGAEHADYIFNRVYLNAVVRGSTTPTWTARSTPASAAATLRGRADFIGLNYYFRSRVTGLGAPASTTVPLFDFLPTQRYAHPRTPPPRPAPPPAPSSAGRSTRRASAGAAHRRQLRAARLRDRERARRRATTTSAPRYLVDHLRALRARDAGRRGAREGLLRLVARGQLRVGRRLLPALRLLLLRPATRSPAASARARALFRRIARSGSLPAG